MFHHKSAEKSSLDNAIENALSSLETHDPDSQSYAKIIEQLTALHAMKNDSRSDRLSKDTLAMILGNFAGIAMIVGHERAHVVTSKAMSLIRSAK